MAGINEKEVFLNPYVVQMDKLADSLGHLSSTFLKLTDYKRTFTKEENEDMFRHVTDKVCEGKNQKKTHI